MRKSKVRQEQSIADWGVEAKYQDSLGNWHHASDNTIQTLLGVMGVDGSREEPTSPPPVIVTTPSRPATLSGPASIFLESGQRLKASKKLPADLPTGYHWLHFEGWPTPVRLIVSPGKCWLPADLSTWGWAVQLYAARSRDSWGIGDFGDLESLARWSGGSPGAGMLLLNPLSAGLPLKPQQTSPYYPSSRCFFSPLWIHVEWVATKTVSSREAVEKAAQAGRDLNAERLIDRDRIFDLKMKALEAVWSDFAGDEAFDVFCREQGDSLERYAVFCALAEHHGSGWHSWPEAYHRPDAEAVMRFALENSRRLDFHKWLQWLIDQQLARCAHHLALMQDLPIGVDPDGADAWAWQDIFAQGVAVGAPPDEFNTQGQNWGLPPFIPHKLRQAGYEPFIQTIRAALRHGGGLRVDHVMGLFRLYWIPQGSPAKDGAYVRYQADEMLAIVALESERARAYVVGEDLGTVEKEAREKLASYRVMSYRLLWFEKELPNTYPKEALAAITTHDLPTVAGLWTGVDLEKQRDLNLNPNEESMREIRDRLSRITGLEQQSPVEEVVARAYDRLAEASSRILVASLDDAVLVEERPNMPATMADTNPNWCLALPVPIEDLMQRPLAERIAVALDRAR